MKWRRPFIIWMCRVSFPPSIVGWNAFRLGSAEGNVLMNVFRNVLVNGSQNVLRNDFWNVQ